MSVAVAAAAWQVIQMGHNNLMRQWDEDEKKDEEEEEEIE